jgi:hypothetical protein
VTAVAADQTAVGELLLYQSTDAFSCQIKPFTYAISVTPLVVMSATPQTATWPAAVIVHTLPAASAIAAVEPASTTVSFGEAAAKEFEVNRRKSE